MRVWSKLQKKYYGFRAGGLNIQLHCNAHRMKSQWGNAKLSRYWITLGKEIIWDYPKDFFGTKHPEQKCQLEYLYLPDVTDISDLIEEYLNTSKHDIMNKIFDNDKWGLINILRASDRRIGTRRLHKLKKKTNNVAARKIIDVRLCVDG